VLIFVDIFATVFSMVPETRDTAVVLPPRPANVQKVYCLKNKLKFVVSFLPSLLLENLNRERKKERPAITERVAVHAHGQRVHNLEFN